MSPSELERGDLEAEWVMDPSHARTRVDESQQSNNRVKFSLPSNSLCNKSRCIKEGGRDGGKESERQSERERERE